MFSTTIANVTKSPASTSDRSLSIGLAANPALLTVPPPRYPVVPGGSESNRAVGGRRIDSVCVRRRDDSFLNVQLRLGELNLNNRIVGDGARVGRFLAASNLVGQEQAISEWVAAGGDSEQQINRAALTRVDIKIAIIK